MCQMMSDAVGRQSILSCIGIKMAVSMAISSTFAFSRELGGVFLFEFSGKFEFRLVPVDYLCVSGEGAPFGGCSCVLLCCLSREVFNVI